MYSLIAAVVSFVLLPSPVLLCMLCRCLPRQTVRNYIMQIPAFVADKEAVITYLMVFERALHSSTPISAEEWSRFRPASQRLVTLSAAG